MLEWTLQVWHGVYWRLIDLINKNKLIPIINGWMDKEVGWLTKI